MTISADDAVRVMLVISVAGATYWTGWRLTNTDKARRFFLRLARAFPVVFHAQDEATTRANARQRLILDERRRMAAAHRPTGDLDVPAIIRYARCRCAK